MASKSNSNTHKQRPVYDDFPTIISDFPPWIGDLDLPLLREAPVRRKAFCDLIKEFGYTHPQASNMRTFSLAARISRKTLDNWRHALPDLDEAFLIMKEAIFARRKLAWDMKILSDTNYLRDSHIYEPEELELNKYHADLTKQATPVPTQTWCKCNLVPDVVTGEIKPMVKVVVNDTETKNVHN